MERSGDVDSLVTRRLRSVGDFFQVETTNVLLRLENRVCQRFDFFLRGQIIKSFVRIVVTDPFEQALRRFVVLSPFLRLIDQLNPLSSLTQKRRLTGLGPGGLTLSNRKVEVRTIHPSYFGLLCPTETPEGQNAGIVSSFVLIGRLRQRSFLYSSIIKSKKGVLQFTSRGMGLKPRIVLWIFRKQDA